MFKKEHFRIYVATYLVLKIGEKVLLLRRCNTGYRDGYYSLVGGHLDGGEKVTHCMVREAKEEIGITLNPEDLRVVHVAHRIKPDREYIDMYLLADKWVDDPTIKEPEKCDDLQWSEAGNLPDNTVPEVKEALENIDKGIFYSEFGW